MNKWLIGIGISLGLAVFGMLVSWLSWLTLTVVAHSSELKSVVLTQSNVIPPVVENSLHELRQKTNEESKSSAEATSKLMQIAVENSKDIGYIKAEIVKLQERK